MSLVSLTNFQSRNYYYGFKGKIYLNPSKEKFVISYSNQVNKKEAQLFLENADPDTKIKWKNSHTAIITCQTEKTKEKLVSLLKSREDVYTCQPYYTMQEGGEMVVTEHVVVKFLPGISLAKQNDLHKKLGTNVVEDCEIFQIVKLPRNGDAVEIAKKYFESEMVKFSEPDFFANVKPHQVFPNDPYFNYQITLHNTGQIINDGHWGATDVDIDAPYAWEITTGSYDIVIAVIDEGVTSNHHDLPNSRQVRLTGSDFVDGTDPSPTGNENHGNACAGVIAATMNNNEGIAGIAPDCKIMPIRISFESSTWSDFANAIRFAADNGAEIISNSWGDDDMMRDPNWQQSVVTAIQDAVDSGRDGNTRQADADFLGAGLEVLDGRRAGREHQPARGALVQRHRRAPHRQQRGDEAGGQGLLRSARRPHDGRRLGVAESHGAGVRGRGRRRRKRSGLRHQRRLEPSDRVRRRGDAAL